jgi:hypothetical protein
MCHPRFSAEEQDFCVNGCLRIGNIVSESIKTVFSGNSTEEHKLFSRLIYSDVKLLLKMVSAQAHSPHVTHKKPGRKLSKSSNKREELSLRRSLERLTSHKGQVNGLYSRCLTCDGSLRRFCQIAPLQAEAAEEAAIFGLQKCVFSPSFLLAWFAPSDIRLLPSKK